MFQIAPMFGGAEVFGSGYFFFVSDIISGLASVSDIILSRRCLNSALEIRPASLAFLRSRSSPPTFLGEWSGITLFPKIIQAGNAEQSRAEAVMVRRIRVIGFTEM